MSVYLPIALFISTRSSSGINLATLDIKSATFFLLCILSPLSCSILAKPLLPSCPSTIVFTKSAGILAGFNSLPRSTFSFQDSMSSFIFLATALESFLLNLAVLFSITVLAIPSSVSPVSSNPEAPRNLPKPSCAAPATPPRREEKAV